MLWTLNEPKLGDIIRVKMGEFYHYGIYVSDDEIIQFGLPFTDPRRDSRLVEVCSSNIETFLDGKFLEVGKCERKDGKKRKPCDVVNCARNRIGEKGYHILYNNCEHFAFECMFGKKASSQVDIVRQMWKHFPFVHIYVKQYPFDVDRKNIYPKERQTEIDKCGCSKVKEEKYYSWKLLEYGLHHSLGLDIKDVHFQKTETKWLCKECKFSISHCENIVVVAIARNDVGIDIEKIDLDRFSLFPKEKILTVEELQKETTVEEINKLWTVKEAAFKYSDEKTFIPNKINSDNFSYITKKINNNYFLSVVSKDISVIKYYLNDNLNIN